MLLKLATAAWVLAMAGTAQAADDEIYYGSRVGMSVTTLAKRGIGTAKAVITVRHTPRNAKEYCVGYESDYSTACVKRTMADVKVLDRVTADCAKNRWTDVNGRSYALIGRNKGSEEVFADYLVRDTSSGEILDGSSASGYGVAIATLQALCPSAAR